ncbi:MAG: hypothetical protein HY741_11400 [Chloroflexi bacterium]|nr:hypothetical protein [Chloroflexota bacterium]
MDSNAKATIIAAVIGGICVCLAAFISLFSPITSQVAERFLAAPSAPPTIVLSSVTAAAPTGAAQTSNAPQADWLTFILVNNLPFTQDIYSNGTYAFSILSGSYQTLRWPRGKWTLQNCPNGMNPRDFAPNCQTRDLDFQQDPFLYVLEGRATPETEATFIVRNISQHDADLYVDGKFTTGVNASNFAVLRLARGEHTFEWCLRGIKPPNPAPACRAPERAAVEVAVFTFDITD